MIPELLASLAGLGVAFLGAATLVVGAAGLYYVGLVKNRRELSAKQHELAVKELELKQLELDERLRQKTKSLALDAAAIAQETSLGRKEPLTGTEKASLAADKLREMEPSLANADRSMVTDLVKLGASQLRSSQSSPSHPAVLSPGTYLISPSQAPPPDVMRPTIAEDRPTLPPLKRTPLPRKESR